MTQVKAVHLMRPAKPTDQPFGEGVYYSAIERRFK